MNASITKPENFHVEIRRFKNLDRKIRDQIHRLCPPADRDRPGYVIYAGSGTERDHGGIHSVIAYKSASSALVLTRSPVTLASRGEVNHLEADEVYFIPEDRAAKLRTRKIYAAAAAVLLLLSAGLFALLGGEDVPGPYRDLALRLPREMQESLYASLEDTTEADFASKREAWVLKLMQDAILNDYHHLEEFIPFCEAVAGEELFDDKTRSMAFHELILSAWAQEKPEIILAYRRHPDPDIREMCVNYLSNAKVREKFRKAGIDLEE
jgi:hypothetical protein